MACPVQVISLLEDAELLPLQGDTDGTAYRHDTLREAEWFGSDRVVLVSRPHAPTRTCRACVALTGGCDPRPSSRVAYDICLSAARLVLHCSAAYLALRCALKMCSAAALMRRECVLCCRVNVVVLLSSGAVAVVVFRYRRR
jgi:hypothetical protein